MGRSAVLALCAAAFMPGSGIAGENAPDAGTAPQRHYPSGIFSHGDSGDFVEEAYGSQVEPQPRDGQTAANKRDPAIRWEGPAPRR